MVGRNDNNMEPDNLNDTKTKPETDAPKEPFKFKPAQEHDPVVHVMHEQKARKLLTIAVYILAAFLVSVIVIWFGKWLYDKTAKPSTGPAVSANTAKVPEQPTTTSSNNQSSTSPTPTTPPANTGTTANPSTTASTQLPNSGPGDVVAIFIGASVVFGGLHYIYSLRRSLS